MPETPALSPSIAHVLTSESPLHAWTIHPLLGNRPRPPTEAQERGSLIHTLLLGEGRGVEVIDAPDFRSKEARAARDAAREAGLIPITTEKYEAANTVAGHLGKRIAELGISLSGGSIEKKLTWTEASSGEVLCHGTPDFVSKSCTAVVEIKTSLGRVHPDICAAKLLREGGVIQEAAYRSAIETLHPEVAGRVEVLFLFCELRDPWAVTPILCAGSMQEIGVGRWERAVAQWSRCLRTGEWPSYTDKPIRVEAPAWALALEMMEDL